MPRKRRIEKRRTDQLSLNQRTHLAISTYFSPDWYGADPGFEDDAHRREVWAAHREEILAEWDHPGRRPDAMWLYNFGLEPCDWPRNWDWPPPIETEEEMVYRLLEAGELEGCHLNGCVRISNELAEIEAGWLRELEWFLGSSTDRPLVIDEPLTTYGTPTWFYARHAPRIKAKLEAEAARWRASRLAGNGEAVER